MNTDKVPSPSPIPCLLIDVRDYLPGSRWKYCLCLLIGICLLLPITHLPAQDQDLFVSELSQKDGLTPGGVMNFFQDAQGYLWICTIAGLNRYDGNEITNYVSDPIDMNSLSVTPVHDVTQDQTGKMWIATRGGGLNSYDPATGQFIHYRHDRADAQSVASDDLAYIDIDEQGQLWIGSQTGLTSLDPVTGSARQFYPAPGKAGQLQGNCRGEIIADAHRIYLGTSAGFEYYDRQSCHFRFFPLLDTATGDTLRYQVYGMARDRQGKVWFGLPGRGLRMYDPELDTVVRVEIRTAAGDRNTRPMRMLEDQSGALWIAGYSEIWRISPDRRHMERLQARSIQTHELLSRELWSIFEDRSGLIWFGGPARRALYFDPRREVFQFHQLPVGSTLVTCAQQDTQGQVHIWISTNGGGLNRFSPATERFVHYTMRDGLPSNIVFDLTFDGQGLLWLNTPKGISCFDPKRGTFKNFNENDGLQCWTEDLHFQPSTNTIIAAGKKGLNYFHPTELLHLPKSTAPVTIVSIAHFDPVKQQMQPLLPIAWADGRLSLSYLQNTLRLQFAVLNFRNPTHHRYRYSLTDGPEAEWVDLQDQHQIELARLKSGEYNFKLQGINSDGQPSQAAASLHIIIHPPFWRSIWAYIFYLLLLSGLFTWVYRYHFNRQLALREARQIKAVDALRRTFFTNLTHEFRTPLTIILGLADAQGNSPKAMALIKRNGQKLLNLINQLLDLAKLENGHMQAHYQQMEMISLTHYLIQSFHSLAGAKHIQLSFDSTTDSLWMDIDEEKYQQIISNLLNNAIKFTDRHGVVSLQIERNADQLRIRVSDNGQGIAPEHIPHLFDRFYQVKSTDLNGQQLADLTGRYSIGTGIGLSIVKDYVELMGGDVQVKSSLTVGTTFTVQLPIRQNTARKRSLPSVPLPSTVEAVPASLNGNPAIELPRLLIIEDNPDVLLYMHALLQDRYHVFLAYSGMEGIEKACQNIPDIIISDVMMPGMDGFTVVQQLKQDERTCHIPIILLTAKASQADRLSGLQYGADAYLMKPFDQKELFVRLEQLLLLRRRLQARYTQSVAVRSAYATAGNGAPNAAASLDELFLQKIRQIVEDKIADADLDIEYLCRKLQLSSSQLFRKMKALTGEAPISFIRHIRLQRAKEILLSTNKSVAEVAYAIGYTDPNYFSRAFSKEFGCSPNNIRK